MPTKKKAAKKKATKRYRSAKTGKFITEKKALKKPNTSVGERIS